MTETWKDIPDYEGLYQASNLGRIKSVERFVRHHAGGKQILSERILKSTNNGTGYFHVTLSHHNKQISKYVHRLVIESFKGLSQLHTDHINHIRSDNRIENLQYVTIRENQSRRLLNKKTPVGVRKIRNKFRACISINKKTLHLGYFSTPELASQAYINKLKEVTNER